MVMPSIPDRIKQGFADEQLLRTQTHKLDEIPTVELHKPRDEKWIAARLSIPHEFTWRVVPSVARKIARKKVTESGGHPDDEVWLHRKPTDEELDAYVAAQRECGNECGRTAWKKQLSKEGNPVPASVPPNAHQKSEEPGCKEWRN